jgi:hypothetical protein
MFVKKNDILNSNDKLEYDKFRKLTFLIKILYEGL